MDGKLKTFAQKPKLYIDRFFSGITLLYGGILFVILGFIVLAIPNVSDWGVSTGLKFYNLDLINIALFLTIIIVGEVGGFSFISTF